MMPMFFLVFDVMYYTDGRLYSKQLISVRLSFDAAIVDADRRECATIEVPGIGEVYFADSIYSPRQMTDEDLEKTRRRMAQTRSFSAIRRQADAESRTKRPH